MSPLLGRAAASLGARGWRNFAYVVIPGALDQVCLRDAADNVIVARADRAEQWIGRAQARMDLCYVQATFAKENANYRSQSLTRVDLSEMRVDPVLLHRVT
ncbi:hypothetical protein [Bradyrhizobium uaiense]|uniref:hypothetical protein n=1 Tax=Bradyrhizobium uaiense TaxID=2594946 RepID=UPI001F449961|nr:hypothetical protein [Bradyrhizobium uaiense]